MPDMEPAKVASTPFASYLVAAALTPYRLLAGPTVGVEVGGVMVCANAETARREALMALLIMVGAALAANSALRLWR